ncbi:MAG: class I SAM-dependent methyltransferase [Candidatus Eisenbacteria bacterium]|nr:class I SAM-dependent methyltransferase [Candidatus Eisenbacteria bacterium]
MTTSESAVLSRRVCGVGAAAKTGTEAEGKRVDPSPASPSSISSSRRDAQATATLSERFLRSAFFHTLSAIEYGELIVHEGATTRAFGTPGSGLRAEISVLDPDFYREVALHGSVGAGRAWFEGKWTSDDLVSVVRILARNDAALKRWSSGIGRVLTPAQRVFHLLRRNTRTGSRRNIEAHYDLSNDFFSLFLDETMTYSAGIFSQPETSLREASVEKLDRICRVLELEASDHVLEIGTGWGSFAIHAARNYGCRVTTTTISKEQHALATARVHDAGLEDRVTVILKDYRDLEGTFDKLVSIEMIEAVGHDFLDTYFRTCCERLSPGGRMCLQAITIRDDLHDQARRSLDFIKRYIFPGSDIPSVRSISTSVARATDFAIVDTFDLTEGYAHTLRAWRHNLAERANEVRALGFDDRFLAMWDFYFAYCEGGFLERRIQDYQFVLERRDADRSGDSLHDDAANQRQRVAVNRRQPAAPSAGASS